MEQCSKETVLGTYRFSSRKAESSSSCLLAIHNLYRILNTKYLLILSGLPARYSDSLNANANRWGGCFPGNQAGGRPMTLCSAEMSCEGRP